MVVLTADGSLGQFPRELDVRLGRHLSDVDVGRFAREDPKVRRHLDLIRRKELLELALDKIESLKNLDPLDRRPTKISSQVSASSSKDRNQRWNLF